MKRASTRSWNRLRTAAMLSSVLVLPTWYVGASRAAGITSVGSGAPAKPVLELFHTHELADEPTIAVDAQGRVFYQSWNFYLGKTRVLISTDRGQSWAPVTDPSNAGVTVDPDGERVHPTVWDGDPRVAVDPQTGRVFYAGDRVQETPRPAEQCTGRLRYSDDAGQSWSAPTCVTRYPEYERLAVGPAPAGGPAAVGYPNVVYWCGQENDVAEGEPSLVTADQYACAASLDGGQSFGPFGDVLFHQDQLRAPTVYCGVQIAGATGRVGSNGWLYMPGEFCTEDSSGVATGLPGAWVSRDEGKTWSFLGVPGHATATEHVVPGQESPSGHVGLALTDDVIAFAWIDRSDNMPWLAVSHDGGTTWNAQRVPAPADPSATAPADTAQPVLASSGNKVALAYVGGDRDGNWKGYVTVTANISAPSIGLTTYEVPDGPLWTGGGCGHAVACGANGEFMDVAMAPDGTVYAAFVDGCSADAITAGFTCTNSAWTGEGVVARLRI